MPHPDPVGPADCLAVVAPIAARVARRNYAEADDLAQEAMAAVVEHWGRYDPAFGKSRRAWVRELADHAITDAFRRSTVGRSVIRVPVSAYACGVRRPTLSLNEMTPTRPGERPATHAECVPARPESGDTDPDEFLRFASSLAGRLLTAGERNAVVLHYVGGLTVTEAAARLGCACCTVVTILTKFAADCRENGGDS